MKRGMAGVKRFHTPLWILEHYSGEVKYIPGNAPTLSPSNLKRGIVLGLTTFSQRGEIISLNKPLKLRLYLRQRHHSTLTASIITVICQCKCITDS